MALSRSRKSILMSVIFLVISTSSSVANFCSQGEKKEIHTVNGITKIFCLVEVVPNQFVQDGILILKKNKITTLKMNMKLGEPHGKFEAWNDVGVKLSEGNYVLGKKYGLWRYWSDRGEPLYCEFHEDNIPVKKQNARAPCVRIVVR